MTERYHQDRAKELGLPEGTGKRYTLEDLLRFSHRVGLAQIDDEYIRGINCPLSSIVETRIVHDGVADKFDAVIITREQGREKAFRWVGSFSIEAGKAISLDCVGEQASAFIEDPFKVAYMQGVVIDSYETFGPHMYTDRVQAGGLTFVQRESAQGLMGVWEELEGNGQGAFCMIRRWSRITAQAS